MSLSRISFSIPSGRYSVLAELKRARLLKGKLKFQWENVKDYRLFIMSHVSHFSFCQQTAIQKNNSSGAFSRASRMSCFHFKASETLSYKHNMSSANGDCVYKWCGRKMLSRWT